MKKKHSLKLVIVSLAFLCWLIPILLMVAVMGYYVLSKQDDEQLERLAEQMAASSRICQERLDGAIANSRRISYDKTVQQKYEQYQRGELSYAALYSEVQYYLSVEYSRKKEAAFALIMMNGKEKDESFNVVNSSAGGSYQGILDFWEQDAELVKECAAKLDTAIGFVQNQGRLYLVRNMMNSRFKSWGVIVLCLNKDYCFETLLSGQENVGLSVDLSGENVLSQGINGKLPELTWDSTGRYQVEKGKIYLTFRIKSSDYTLKTLMIHSREELPVPLYGYEYVVIGMLACLLPLCLLMFVVFRRQVNQPIRTLMESAGEIEKGNLGYQISEEAANREFQYLKEAFNQMSGRLKYQFDHIYEEELALKDARIMALQSHINPHFMNNTLEIINWEARLAGNDKVSEMIGSLGTLLDAALDRKKQPEVPLKEELTYVKAYLFIMKERFGKRLEVTLEIPEELYQEKVPRLILQPVIENAIAHGVQVQGTGKVRITGKKEQDFLILAVHNDGTMTEEDKARIERLLKPDYNTSRESSGNLGIANVNQRLRILYGEESGLSIFRRNDGVQAEIKILIR